MLNILFIHQSAELYGSDKTLLLLLKNLNKSQFNATVVLPFDGPLKQELELAGVKVVIAPVLKLYRKMMSPKGLIGFLSDIKKAYKILDKLRKETPPDIIYSNTLAVLLGIFYARKTKIKHLWHVHEIIESPKIFTKTFKKLLAQKQNTRIVYNSYATRNFWSQAATKDKELVIWNGIETPKVLLPLEEVEQIKQQTFQVDKKHIIIALVGRISRWKGQQVLLEAFEELTKEFQNIKLVFIGSPPPNQEGFQMQLEEKIAEKKLQDKVTLISFTKDIEALWQSIDIAVVPSIEPEPFGLVAVEAMLAKKPVIASNHGGVAEIVVHNQSGFLVKPNDADDLKQAIKKLILDEDLRKKMGETGYQVALQNFSIESYVKNFENLFQEIKGTKN